MRGVVSLVVVAAVAGGGWYGYRAFNSSDETDQFITAEIERGSIVKTVTATGTIEPTILVLVGTQVSGTVTRWYADFNQSVRAGETLLELDQDRYRSELEQRTAAVRIAEARVAEAEVRHKDLARERKRIEGLYERRVASENEFLQIVAMEEAMKATLLGVQAELESARAAEKAAAVDLSRTVIESPIDGIVISRDVDAGQTVAASLQTPTLFTIAADLRQMQVHAAVAEADVGQVREGMKADFTVDAYPDRRFDGIVSQVRFNPTIIDNIVTYVTLIDVDNENLLLRPGMTANVTFEVARVDDVLRVPNAAMRFSPTPQMQMAGDRRPMAAPRARGGPRVYKLIDGKPTPVSINVGLSDGAYSQLLDDSIAAGEHIIVERRWGGGESGPRRAPRTGGPF
jgi:HlyD family secretion protein